MSATRPEFIRVVPGEVERYGANAALVLAHIRFRCESDGPGRVIVDGVRHWRVSYAGLGSEVGLTARECRRAIEDRLGDALTAKHLAPLNNWSRAYALTSQVPLGSARDQPEAAVVSPAVDESVRADPGGSSDDHTVSSADPGGSCTTYREAGEGGERRSPVGEGTAGVVMAESANEQKQPQRYCSRHMPDGTDEPCGACGRRREAFDRWTADASAAESARLREAATARRFSCGRCFDTGTVRNSNGVPAKGRPRCSCAAAQTATMASDQEMA